MISLLSTEMYPRQKLNKINWWKIFNYVRVWVHSPSRKYICRFANIPKSYFEMTFHYKLTAPLTAEQYLFVYTRLQYISGKNRIKTLQTQSQFDLRKKFWSSFWSSTSLTRISKRFKFMNRAKWWVVYCVLVSSAMKISSALRVQRVGDRIFHSFFTHISDSVFK